MRKTATIMEEPNDGLHEKQKHGRRYGRRLISLAFGSGWTAISCIEHNKKNVYIHISLNIEIKFIRSPTDLAISMLLYSGNRMHHR